MASIVQTTRRVAIGSVLTIVLVLSPGAALAQSGEKGVLDPAWVRSQLQRHHDMEYGSPGGSLLDPAWVRSQLQRHHDMEYGSPGGSLLDPAWVRSQLQRHHDMEYGA